MAEKSRTLAHTTNAIMVREVQAKLPQCVRDTSILLSPKILNPFSFQLIFFLSAIWTIDLRNFNKI